MPATGACKEANLTQNTKKRRTARWLATLTLTRSRSFVPTLSLTAHVLLLAVLLPWRCNRDELLLLVRSNENAGGAHSAQTLPARRRS